MSSAESEVVSQGGSSPPLPDCAPIPRPIPVNISSEVKSEGNINYFRLRHVFF